MIKMKIMTIRLLEGEVWNFPCVLWCFMSFDFMEEFTATTWGLASSSTKFPGVSQRVHGFYSWEHGHVQDVRLYVSPKDPLYLLGHMFVVSMVSITWLLVIWVAASSPRSHHCQRNWLRVWLREWCFVSYSSKLSSSKHQPCHIPASFLQKKRQHCSRKQKLRDRGNCELGGGFNCVLISPLVGEMVQSDRYVSDGLKPPTRFRLHMLDP